MEFQFSESTFKSLSEKQRPIDCCPVLVRRL